MVGLEQKRYEELKKELKWFDIRTLITLRQDIDLLIKNKEKEYKKVYIQQNKDLKEQGDECGN